MSYTNTKVIWKKCLFNGESIADVYGDLTQGVKIIYLCCSSNVHCSQDLVVGYEEKIDDSKLVRVRKQPKQQVFKTNDGRELLCKCTYYLDPRVEPYALEIAKMDLLDGNIVEDIYIMCDLFNRPKMVRVITV